MHRLHRQFVVALAVLGIALGQASVSAAQSMSQENWAKTQEVAFYRPAGFIFTIIGPPLFLAGLPFALLQLNGLEGVQNSWEELVVCPARYTFKNGLGDHPSCPE
jgi:hypothetical protein